MHDYACNHVFFNVLIMLIVTLWNIIGQMWGGHSQQTMFHSMIFPRPWSQQLPTYILQWCGVDWASALGPLSNYNTIQYSVLTFLSSSTKFTTSLTFRTTSNHVPFCCAANDVLPAIHPVNPKAKNHTCRWHGLTTQPGEMAENLRSWSWANMAYGKKLDNFDR